MLRSFQKLFCLLSLVVGLQHAKAFTLLGEFDDWQVNTLGFGFGEIGGSKNLGEEFRLNTPVVTYGYDSTFLDFFGPEGVKAIDQAFAIMNKIPPASRMTTNLMEFLLDDAQRTLPSAETLTLRDLKSYTLGLIVEYMGLAGEEHVFDLRQRIPFTSPLACQFDYQVVLRNFDPVNSISFPSPTRDVNGVTYGYLIVDSCPNPNFAFAEERTIDPSDIPFNAVASWKGGGLSTPLGLRMGAYYINITRDDAGGLRHLYSRTNYNNEVLPNDARASAFSGPWQPIDFLGTNALSTNSLALRGGIDKVTFRKVRFDSGFSTFFKPIVQSYKLQVRTNFTTIKQSVRRAVFRPDILISAADLGAPPTQIPLGPPFASRTSAPRYLTNGVTGTPSSVGPGTVIPQSNFTFHKTLPQYFNSTPFFLDDVTAEPGFLWASFDGSTNAPFIYPNLTMEQVEQIIFAGSGGP